MNKKKAMLYATGAFAAFMLVISVLGLTASFTFVQDLTVPEASTTGIVVYQSDGTTALDDGGDLSTLWSWNPAATRFELTIVVKNVGTKDVTTTVSSGDVPSGWTLSSSADGVLISGTSQTVNVYLTKSDASPGEKTDPWHFTVSAT